MELQGIQDLVNDPRIAVTRLRTHAKASEKYVDVIFRYPDQEDWDGSIPYSYRRTGLFLETETEIAELLKKAYVAVRNENAQRWLSAENTIWDTEYQGKSVTRAFFTQLSNLRWNCVDGDLPPNRNWARRIQAIKEMGYLLATDTARYDARSGKKMTQVLLIPLEKGAQTGYEVFSPALRKRIIKALGSYDAYEGKVRPSYSLLPDHKFPEISWDEHTRAKNPDDMTDEEIRAKFQLLDNQRNLEKREACRRVIQTGDLGTLFGIGHRLNETGKWPDHIPKIGKASEEGWKLCPWYDIEAWRRSLNALIQGKKNG